MNELSNKELSGLAYSRVKEMVLSGQLKPGQKIVQDKLARSLGISRTPLRGALQMLEAEYLVESVPRRGVFVRTFDNEKIIEVYDCRIALETIAIRKFTELATPADIRKLKSFFDPFNNRVGEIDSKAYQKSDMKFHDYIIKKSGNDFLAELFKQSNLLIFINQIGLVRPSKETLPEHYEIIDAIEAGEVDRAEELAKEHLLKSKDLIIKNQ